MTPTEKLNFWLKQTKLTAEDRAEIEKIKKENNQSTITELFGQDLQFGTGGLRAIIGLGSSRINHYNLARATQAFANVILNEQKLNATNAQHAVVVSFDSRHKSIEFAKQTAQTFAANGIKAYLFDQLTPTPILSFCLRKLKAAGGVMITASHNPAKYNGYKAYWQDGAQVTPPFDQMIIDEYLALTDWSKIQYGDFEQSKNNEMIVSVPHDIIESYYQMVANSSLNPKLCNDHGSDIKIIYTSLHGTGKIPCEKIAHKLGFKHFQLVKAQESYDGNFPTVDFPNPEEKSAMLMAVNLMLETKAHLAFGTDPDTDRLGVVVNHHQKPIYLNGNQIGLIMLDYIIKERKKNGTLHEGSLVIKSIVTSKVQDLMIKKNHLKLIETLTGFKWMSRELAELEKNKIPFNYLFASEESFGYMPSDEVRDKDAVHSLALMSEICLHHFLKMKTLVDALNDIYLEYGFYSEDLISKTYEGLEGAQKIKRIMDYFRNHCPQYIGQQKIVKKWDYLNSTLINLENEHLETIKQIPSDVLGFKFHNGDYIYLRPSGTEPKIKFYLMSYAAQGTMEQMTMIGQKQLNLYRQEIETIIESI